MTLPDLTASARPCVEDRARYDSGTSDLLPLTSRAGAAGIRPPAAHQRDEAPGGSTPMRVERPGAYFFAGAGRRRARPQAGGKYAGYVRGLVFLRW